MLPEGQRLDTPAPRETTQRTLNVGRGMHIDLVILGHLSDHGDPICEHAGRPGKGRYKPHGCPQALRSLSKRTCWLSTVQGPGGTNMPPGRRLGLSPRPSKVGEEQGLPGAPPARLPLPSCPLPTVPTGRTRILGVNIFKCDSFTLYKQKSVVKYSKKKHIADSRTRFKIPTAIITHLKIYLTRKMQALSKKIY